MGRIFFRKPFKYEYKHRVLLIILLNFAVYAIAQLYRQVADYIYTFGPMNPVAVYKYHMYWQFVTYMFVHGSLSHLFFNMLGLYFFGIAVEQSIGSKEFLLFYPTLLLYYDQTIASLDHNRAESVRRQCNISGFSIHNSKTNNHLL